MRACPVVGFIAVLASSVMLNAPAQTAPVTQVAPTTFKFAFGNVTNPNGMIVVPADLTYSPGKCGFDLNTHPQAFDHGATGVGSDLPFAFLVDVPEGNYKVTVMVGGPQESTTTILAESRRLMIDKVQTDAGKTQTVDFIVNVRNAHLPAPPRNAPGGGEVRLTSLDNPLTRDERLTLEFTNAHPAVQTIQIEPVNVPTVFIMGDSTVTEQPRDPSASWGQMLPAFLKDTVAIANHATSGETLKSSITALRLDKVLSQMKPGDYLLMQCGHNDEKQSWPQTYVDPETTFKAYINVFIAEARRHGATPVAAFNDQTHHRTYGAYEIAKIIATGIRATNLPLTKELRDDFKDFDPAHPDKLADFNVPMSFSGTGRPPQGN